MFNFVALASENEWLASLDIDALNTALAARRERHRELVDSGEFWGMGMKEKEAVAPEVHRVAWVPLHQVSGIRYMVWDYPYFTYLYIQVGFAQTAALVVLVQALENMEKLCGLASGDRKVRQRT